MNIELIFNFLKLIIGGIVCFLAILMMSKTRDFEWMLIICASLITYFFEIIELFIELGLISIHNKTAVDFLVYIIPCILYIIAFIIKILKKRG